MPRSTSDRTDGNPAGFVFQQVQPALAKIRRCGRPLRGGAKRCGVVRSLPWTARKTKV